MTRPLRCAALLALATFVPAPAVALDPTRALTQFAHDVWQIEQGLPQNTVSAIAQTSDGYLWLGTAEGLARFDGVRFTVYDRRNTPAFGNNAVSALRADGETLWIGTDGGLLRRRRGTFEVVDAGPTFKDARISALVPDGAGAMWVGTRDHGAFRIAGAEVRAFGAAQGLRSPQVTAIAVAGGAVHIGTEAGVHRVSPGGTVAEPIAACPVLVQTLTGGADGTLWIGTHDRGVFVLAEGACRPHAPALARDGVRALLEDEDGTVFAATVDAGLARIRRGPRGPEVDRFTTAQGLSDDSVWSLARDAEGSLWVGTLGGGLNRLREGKFLPFTRRDGLGNDAVRALAQDRGGAVWVGSHGGGVTRIENGRITRTFTAADGLPHDRIYALAEDAVGALWIGGIGPGLGRMAKGRVETVRVAGGLVDGGVHNLLRARDGALWVGTYRQGLFRVPPAQVSRGTLAGPFELLTTRDGLPHDGILALLEARDGNLWVGTRGGLARIRKGRVAEAWDRDSGLPSDFVFALHQDEEGAVWIGTFGGGLARLKDGRLSVLSTRHGLFDDVVYAIADDGLGNLWLTCNRGIFRIARKELDAVADGRAQAVRSIVYGLADGMPSAECNAGGSPALRTRDGRLWFATVKGAVVIDPARIPKNQVVPQVHVEDVLVDGRSLGGGPSLTLPPGGENFEFRYTATSLSAPSRVAFRYKLEGLDADWLDAGTRRVAYYNRVPHGRYTFRVLAANDDGVWNETGAAVALAVAPRFTETRAFYALLAGALVLLGLGAHRLRVRTMAARQRELEELVVRRTADLRASEASAQQAREEAVRASQAKSAFLSRMSHELRTPLNGILGFAQIMLQDRARTEQDREALEVINRSGEHLLRLINDVLSLARIEAGRMTVDPRVFDPRALVREVEAMFRLPARRRGLRVEVEVAPDVPARAVGDEGKLRQVLINLAGNAMKFTEQGAITLRAAWPEGILRLEVEDTGPGIPPDQRSLLFKAFSQTDTGRRSGEGTGLGLAISSSFVRLMGGTLTVHEGRAGGALFRVDVPLEPAEEDAPVPSHRRRVRAPGDASRRMLVVDDIRDNRLVLARMLASLGFEVKEASDGAAAIEEWTRWHPHVVWMDVRMGGVSGPDATREIRRREAAEGLPRTPVVAVTASALEEDRPAILESGCDEVVPKPITEAAIVGALERHAGVKFVDAPEAARAAAADPVGDQLAARVAAVAEEWRLGLEAALLRGDVLAAQKAADRIREEDAGLGDALRVLIREYRFDEVLSALTSGTRRNGAPGSAR